jgi:hypothetical protein
MYIREDISKFLRDSHPNKVMVILGHPGELLDITTVADKLLLAQAWVKAYKPEDKLPKLKEYLGEYWQAYLNPLTEKLHGLDLLELVTGDIGKKLTKDHSLIVNEVIDTKLIKWLDHSGLTKVSTETDFPIKTKRHKLITYQFKSRYSDSYILKISLDWLGFASTCRVSFLNIGYSTEELTAESMKKVQGIMFQISQDWDLSPLDGILEVIDFDNVILDCLIQNVIKHRNTAKSLS